MRSALVLLNAWLCLALIENLKVTNDPRNAFHVVSFAYEKGGMLELVVDDFALMVPHGYTPKEAKFEIAFVFVKSASDAESTFDHTKCLHTDFVVDGDKDDHVIHIGDPQKWKHTEYKHQIDEPGYYHLYFSNCVENTHSRFDLKLTQYNVEGGNKDFLSAGLTTLPLFYGFTFLVFVAMLLFWVYKLFEQWDCVRSIHWLMLVVLVFKLLAIFCETFMQMHLKNYGVHNGWFAAFYVFNFVKGTVMFVSIVLLGTGWSYLKPFLTDRDKQIILAVLVAQVMVNLATVVVGESAPGSYYGLKWQHILTALDLVCCIGILIPIYWSIRHLRAASGTSLKARKNLERLENFRSFYFAVMAYLYVTRILCYMLDSIISYEYAFVAPAAYEIASALFYASTGILFRPQKSSPYLALDKDDDDVDAAELEELTGH
jgi:hypothetical protein